jgi:RHS repeat-associated protein
LQFFQQSVTGWLTTTSGTRITPPIYSNASPGNLVAQDANGNQVTVLNGVYTDTLGQTAVTVMGTQPNNTTLTYTPPAGPNVAYTVAYKAYTVATNFGASGIHEYGATKQYLVDTISLPDTSKYTFTYENTPSTPSSGACTTALPGTTLPCVTGRIASATLPTGGNISYLYTGGSNGINSDGTTPGLNRTLSPGGPWQYSRSGSSPVQTTQIDPAGNQTLVDFEGVYETQRQVYQGSSTLLSTTINCYNGNSILSSCYNTAVSPPITEQVTYRYLPGPTGVVASTAKFFDVGGYGLPIETDEYDYGSLGGQLNGPLVRKTNTYYGSGSACVALSNGIVDRPCHVIIRDLGNNTQAETFYTYDEQTPTATSGTPQHVGITGSRGNLTTVQAKANGSLSLYRHFTYYDTGMLSTSTDVSTSSTTNGATTTYNYASGTASCGNSFATSITEPLSLSRSMTWNCVGGVLLSVTDENSKTTSTAYNASGNVFWRPTSTTDAANNTATFTYTSDSNHHPFQTEGKSATFNSGSSIVDRVVTTDGFGRPIFSQTSQGPGATNYDTVANCYDSFGNVSLTTLPYSAPLATSTSSCPSTNSRTSFTYDALGRISTVTDTGGGSTTYTYALNDILRTTTSPTVSQQSEFDGLGRLKSVCEITAGTTSWPSATCSQNTSATGYLTAYAYDLLDDLTSVTQNAQAGSNHQSRTYAYDMLGRLTSEINPETNSVAATYAYDSDGTCTGGTLAGNLVKRTDPAGNVTCIAYDQLHRPTSLTHPSGTYSTSTDKKYYLYDSATVAGATMQNAKGRLADAYTCPPTGSCSPVKTDLGFSYSPRGELVDTYQKTPNSPSTYYHGTAAYWLNGALQTLSSNLFGLPTQTYGTDGEGRTSSVSDGVNPATSAVYDLANYRVTTTYGSSDSDVFNFATNSGRISQYQFKMGTGPQTDTGALTWNSNGTLQELQITDQIVTGNSQDCKYYYDALTRLAGQDASGYSVNCLPNWAQTFTLDPFGNLSKTSGSLTWMPGYDTNNHYTLGGTSYDANGNLKNDTFNTYTWDAEGKPLTIGSNSYVYDALGRVVEANGNTQTVYAPIGKVALMNGSTLSKAFLGLPGGGTAVYTSGGLAYYRHADWLGSSRLATTPSRTKYYDVAYAPYGESYGGSGTTDLNFTGDNQDMIAGMYDTPNREYHPSQGRWVSPDPAGLAAVNPSDPQTWNRYAYLANRPLNAVDPSGLCDPGEDPVCQCPDPTMPCCDPFLGCCDPMFGCGPGSPDIPPPPETAVPTPPDISKWPNGETLGLPRGLNLQPLSLGSLIGLNPNGPCSFGICIDNIVGDVTGDGTADSPYSILVTVSLPFLAPVSGPANNNTLNGAQQSQGKHWPYKDPSSCSVYGSGGPLNFVCRSAGTTRYANSARGCLQTYWNASTGSYSMTPGGPGAPNKPFLPLPSFISFTDSHAVCLVGAFFY